MTPSQTEAVKLPGVSVALSMCRAASIEARLPVPMCWDLALYVEQLESALSLLRKALEEGEPQPVAWRTRGYNQFRTGEPGEWRYRTGAQKPVVNNPNACDFEPLYTRATLTSASPDGQKGGA